MEEILHVHVKHIQEVQNVDVKPVIHVEHQHVDVKHIIMILVVGQLKAVPVILETPHLVVVHHHMPETLNVNKLVQVAHVFHVSEEVLLMHQVVTHQPIIDVMNMRLHIQGKRENVLKVHAKHMSHAEIHHVHALHTVDVPQLDVKQENNVGITINKYEK